MYGWKERRTQRDDGVSEVCHHVTCCLTTGSHRLPSSSADVMRITGGPRRLRLWICLPLLLLSLHTDPPSSTSVSRLSKILFQMCLRSTRFLTLITFPKLVVCPVSLRCRQFPPSGSCWDVPARDLGFVHQLFCLLHHLFMIHGLDMLNFLKLVWVNPSSFHRCDESNYEPLLVFVGAVCFCIYDIVKIVTYEVRAIQI